MDNKLELSDSNMAKKGLAAKNSQLYSNHDAFFAFPGYKHILNNETSLVFSLEADEEKC